MTHRTVNIINFVRGCEPRDKFVDLYTPIVEEIRLNKKYGYRNTFLLQYDAMRRQDMMELFQKEKDESMEIGIWLEMVRELVEKAGIVWRGRDGYDWDWYADPDLLAAYTIEERKRLIDEIMREFKEDFGSFPKSAGSWVLDAWSMDYMSRAYGVEAFAICREQYEIDAYTLWGGYYAQGYYPSHRNMLCPAEEKTQTAPVFRMLGIDPVYGYDSKRYPMKKSGCTTIEPAWENAADEDQIDWYFRTYFQNECLNFSYIQLGQENSFGWGRIQKGLEKQLEKLQAYVEAGAVSVETLSETGRWFRDSFDTTPAASLIADVDRNENGLQSVWYSSQRYRVNLVKEKNRVFFRDIFLFREDYECRPEQEPCRNWNILYDNLPVVDGLLWNTDEIKSELQFDFPVDEMEVCRKDGNSLCVYLISGRERAVEVILAEAEIRIWTNWQKGLRFCRGKHDKTEIFVHTMGLAITHCGYRYDLPIDGILKSEVNGYRIFPRHGTIGLLTGRSPFEKAKWIWTGEAACTNMYSCFRKKFEMKKDITCAIIRTSAHNHLKLDVNGIRVSGYVTPAPSNPEKGKLYLTYDVTELLREGENWLDATVLYLGGSGQNYLDGKPGFLLRADIWSADGTREVVVSDENWLALSDTPYKNASPYQQNRRITPVECYNAGKEWQNSTDSHWRAAVHSKICDKEWRMLPQEIPEGGIRERIIPAPVGIQKAGVQVFDPGKIISGWPMLHLKGMKGVTVEVRYSEDMEDGRVKHNVTNEPSEYYLDRYTMRGEGMEHWAPDFTYKAFRYLEITGYPEFIEPEQIEVVSAGTFVEQTGAFRCSKAILNEIYDACIQTQKNNLLGQLVDCPHREQAQYLGDSDLQSETLMYNFFHPAVLRKVLHDFRDGQLPNGRFPFVYPSNFENRDFRILIPEYDFHYVTLLEKVYWIYGDQEILASCHCAAVKMLQYYWNARNQETGLLQKGCGFPADWNISDWPYPDVDETGKFLTVENCLFYRNLAIMKNIASLLGKKEMANLFEKQAVELGECIRKHLYLPSLKRYADCDGSKYTHQGVNALAFRCGLVPEKDRIAVLDFVEGEGFASSTLCMLDVLRVLFENGREKAGYDLLCRTRQPGWGYMVRQGFQTMWEGFQNIESHSHAWNGYPARIMQEFLLGIKPLAFAFSEILIQPYIPEDMTYAEGEIKTVQGVVSVRWEKKDGKLLLWTDLPENIRVKMICCGEVREWEDFSGKHVTEYEL